MKARTDTPQRDKREGVSLGGLRLDERRLEKEKENGKPRSSCVPLTRSYRADIQNGEKYGKLRHVWSGRDSQNGGWSWEVRPKGGLSQVAVKGRTGDINR
mmetsp:Transcript_25692/g.64671  ORF Transcript_25692/g.64671 Transcript_25692/m.64671 type:complete len:100 (+) Transcript_25692:3476-3775(+)